jgi:hypothetical protein
VKNLSKVRERERARSRELQESFNAAMPAMTYSSDLGQILEFYKNSLSAVLPRTVGIRLIVSFVTAWSLMKTSQI